MVLSARTGRRVTDADVWDLKSTNQFTREWQWFEEQLSEQYGIESSEPDKVEPAKAATADDIETGSPTVLQDLSDIGGNALAGVAGGVVGTITTLAILYFADLVGVFQITALGSFADLGLGTGSLRLGILLFIGGGFSSGQIFMLH